MKGLNKFLLLATMSLILGACSKVDFGSKPVSKLSERPNYDEDTPNQPEPPGPTPTAQSEQFNQTAQNNKLDILVVADTSLSMNSQLLEIGTEFRKFVPSLQGVDWTLGITTTNMDYAYDLNGNLTNLTDYNDLKILNPLQSGAVDILDWAMSFYDCFDSDSDGWLWAPCTIGDEEPLKASVMAIKSGSNSPLYRSDSNLSILYVQDEDEFDTDGDTYTPQHVIDAFDTQFGKTKKLTAYGIIIEPGDAACLEEETGYFEDPGASYAYTIAELAKRTGGATHSICDRNLKPIFDQIANDAKDNRFTEVTLQHQPIAGSVKVTMVPAQNITFSVKGKVVTLSSAPAPFTQVTVDYTHF